VAVPDYRFLLADALTGVLLEEPPLDVSSYSQQINGVGTLTATMPLTDAPFVNPATGKPLIDWRTVAPFKRTLLIVLRDNVPVWGGRVTKLRPTGTGHTAVELTAETLEGYLAREELQTDQTYTAADAFTIVRGIIGWHQSQTGGNLSLGMGTNLAAQNHTVTYLGKDSPKILDAINRLTEVAPGFEYEITWAPSGNTYTPTMTLAAPALGAGVDAVLLEFPGNLVSPVDYPQDVGDAPNFLTGVGADAAGSPLLARIGDTAGELASGIPLYHGQVSMKEESDTARLIARTTTLLNARLADATVPQVELRGDAEPGFGDLTLGVPVRLRCTCPYHPANPGSGAPGLDVTRRVTGWTVVPGPFEKVTLTLGSLTGKISLPKAQRDVAAYLRDVDRRLRTLETA
jgi:hypothetical protein